MTQPPDEPLYDPRPSPDQGPCPPPYQPPKVPGAAWPATPDRPAPAGAHPPVDDYPSTPLPPPPRRGRQLAGLALLLIMVVGIGGIGAWLLLRDPDRDGPEDPVVAVEAFLQAVYRDHDPAVAAGLVCSQARDETALSAKIDEIRSQAEQYPDPDYTWSIPEVVDETGETAIVDVTVTLTTGDERSAQLRVHLTVLDKDPHGWWVCNLDTAEPAPLDLDPDRAPADVTAEDSGNGQQDEGEQ